MTVGVVALSTIVSWTLLDPAVSRIATGAPPTRATATAASQRFGLNSVTALGLDFAAMLRAGGVRFGRADLGWNFTTDEEDTAVFDGYTSAGISVQPVLNFADKTRVGSVPRRAFARWAVGRMRKFGPGGSYWSDAPKVHPPDSWEVVNEPYFKPYDGRPQPSAYARLFLATYRAARAADLTRDAGGGILLGFATIGDYQRRDGSWSQVVDGGGWLNDALAAQPALRRVLNVSGAVVVHPYGAMWPRDDERWHDYNDGWGRIQLYHRMAVDAGVRAPEWVTEAGYQVGCRGSTCVRDAATQRRYVDQMVDDVQSRPYISMFDYFNAVDYSEWHGGLFRADGAARPSWGTYSRDISR